MFENYPDVLTVAQLAEMLKIGRASAYTLVQNNQVRHVKIGKKYIIPKSREFDL